MSLISKEHLSMVLKSIKKLLSQKVDKSDIVQSDWSQSDETKPDYVKNRTHWEDRKENVEIFNSGLITLNTNDTYYDASQFYKNVDYGSSSIRFINGETYQVNWCGRTDNIIAAYESLYVSNNGLTFYASSINCNITGPNSGETTLPFSTTVSIVGPYTELHPVDEKFIPDSIARIDDVNNDIANLAQRAGVVYYGTCSTAASTSAKVVNLQHSATNFELKTGVIVSVKFTYTNATSMTLNVNSTGAKTVRRLNDTYIDQNYWRPRSYVTFLYEGGYWNIISMALDEATTSYYGLVKLTDSVSSNANVGIAATPWAVKQAYSKAAAALPTSGGTMTGDLTLKGKPTSNLHAATKQYVDENALSIYGGTMKGALTLKEDPVLSKHAVTKQYVDKAIADIDIPEQAPSDWEQNISGAVGYIKNRPFYDGTIYTHTFDGVTVNYVLGADFCEKLYEKREGAKYIVNSNECVFKTDYASFDGQSWSYSVTDGTNEYVVYAYASNNNGSDTIQVITMGGSPLPATISFSVENALHKLDDKFIPDSIARVTDIPDAMLTPTSAQVGQTIIVKSVDENGKPTEWEAVDRTHYDNEQLVGEFTNNDVTFLDEHHTAIYTFTSKLEGLTSNNFEIRFVTNTPEPKIIIPAAEMEFIFSEGSSFVAKHENYLMIMHGCREAEGSFEVANETSVIITMEDGLPSSFFTQVYIRDMKQLDEKFIPNSIARKANVPDAPMMVTTQSIDAGSAFLPSATFAEMLEALKNGTTVWVQIDITDAPYYQVSYFTSHTIQCRKSGTSVYQITSTEGLFRNVNE